MPAEILVPLTLLSGLASLIILPWGLRASRSMQNRVALLVLYLGIIILGYLMGRAGVIADEKGIGCCNTIGPLYNYDWYLMLLLTSVVVAFQVILLRKKSL